MITSKKLRARSFKEPRKKKLPFKMPKKKKLLKRTRRLRVDC